MPHQLPHRHAQFHQPGHGQPESTNPYRAVGLTPLPRIVEPPRHRVRGQLLPP
jgi:hypothetical protein